MDLFRFLLRTSRRTVILAVVSAVFGGLCTVGLLVLIRGYIARSQDAGSLLVLLFAGLGLGAVVSKLSSQVVLIGLSRRSISQLTMHLSERILAAPLQRLEQLGPVRLQQALTQDVSAIAQGLNTVPLMCANGAMVVGCLAFLAVISVPVFATTAAVLALGTVVQLWLMRRARRHMGQTREGQEALAAQIRHLLEGVKELKVHRGRRGAFLNEALRASVDYQEKQSSATQTVMALSNSWGQAQMFLLIGALVFVLPLFVERGRGMMGYYIVAIFFLMQPLGIIKMLIPAASKARHSLRKLESLGVDLTSLAEEAVYERVRPVPAWGSVELAGIQHSYLREADDRGFVLGPLDLTFRPGEVVFLGGGNGSGKTTFAKVLTGLYAPQRGEIRLDGERVTPARREGYRQLFSVVFSEFHLFPSLLGLKDPQLEEKAREYLARLQLDRKVSIRHGRFSTTTRLSRGQQKRLALLVAYLEDRPFYVFDEWASDQDPEFKNIFYTEILADLKGRGKAVLVITHDDRFYHLADRLLFLREGQLVAEDRPQRDENQTAGAPAGPRPLDDQGGAVDGAGPPDGPPRAGGQLVGGGAGRDA